MLQNQGHEYVELMLRGRLAGRVQPDIDIIPAVVERRLKSSQKDTVESTCTDQDRWSSRVLAQTPVEQIQAVKEVKMIPECIEAIKLST